MTIKTAEPLGSERREDRHRRATCVYCKTPWGRPDEPPFYLDLHPEADIAPSYYCGCRGWD